MTHGDQASDRYLPVLRDEIEERDPLAGIKTRAESRIVGTAPEASGAG